MGAALRLHDARRGKRKQYKRQVRKCGTDRHFRLLLGR
jgi:hypothetical protein